VSIFLFVAATVGSIALWSSISKLARFENFQSNLTVAEKIPSRRGSLPHNPGLRELVANKRKWSDAYPLGLGKKGFHGWHERGYLPHRDEPGLIQFVTFHLADSFPATLRSEWEAILKVEDVSDRREQLQAYLDKSNGECLLRRPDLAKPVEDSLRFFHGQRYELRAWVVMPNHVHVLFQTGNESLSRTVENWKKFTAHEANKTIGRQGPFWSEDYWDTFMCNPEHELRTRHYIEANPVKAFLVRAAKNWPWSSARLRDEYGRLML
jgi:REP element-mobilizing transposase RayT